jgi:glutathione S-transferase
MMKLFFAPGACSFVPHVSLALAGATYELQMVKLHKGEQGSPEFLAINPRGQVPVLIDDDRVIDQVVAVVLYLDEQFPEAGILPKTQPARSRALTTLAWMNGGMHATFAHIFMPHKFASDADAKAHIKTHNTALFEAQLHQLDAMCPAVGSDQWLTGSQPCALDAYATTLLRWSGLAGLSPQAFPRIYALANRLLALPQLAQVVAAERYQLEPAPKPAA